MNFLSTINRSVSWKAIFIGFPVALALFILSYLTHMLLYTVIGFLALSLFADSLINGRNGDALRHFLNFAFEFIIFTATAYIIAKIAGERAIGSIVIFSAVNVILFGILYRESALAPVLSFLTYMILGTLFCYKKNRSFKSPFHKGLST